MERTRGLSAAFVFLAASILPVCHACAGTPICVEAEAMQGVTVPMEVVDAAAKVEGADAPVKGASGDKYLEIPEGKGNPPAVTNGEARLEFDVPEDGQYFLWCRVWWEGECSNSFTVNLDNAPPFAFGQDATYKSWHWVKAPAGLKQLTLSKGKHSLTVKNREDGVRLDQILLVADKNYVPVDIEAVTVTK